MKSLLAIVVGMLALAASPAGVVRADERAERTIAVPVATIYPGETIDSSTVREVVLDQKAAPVRDAYASVASVVGQVARKTLLPGRPIPISATRQAYRVMQGRSCRIIYEADGLRIVTEGVLLESGAVGEVVSARNPESGSIVRGTVDAEGNLKVLVP